MKSNLTALGVGLVLVLCAGNAVAQELAEQGTIAIGADRIAGLTFSKLHMESEETQGGLTAKVEGDAKTTQVALFGHDPYVPHTVPRLALDVFVTDGLSLGGSLVYIRQTGEVESEATMGEQSRSDSQDLATGSLLLVAPRVGYAVPIGDGAWFWPRAGVTYTRLTEEDEREAPDSDDTYTVTQTLSYTDLTLEANFVLSPVEHFGFLLGAFYDVPLGGSIKTAYDPSRYEPTNSGPDPDVKVSAFGLQAGIVGWF